jgi:hypothetical protein
MPPAVGDKLGRYEISVPIGKGRMGEVYRARDTRLKRGVAINVAADASPSRLTARTGSGCNGSVPLIRARGSVIPGTESPEPPFCSPDSRWIGFSATSKMQKVDVVGAWIISKQGTDISLVINALVLRVCSHGV